MNFVVSCATPQKCLRAKILMDHTLFKFALTKEKSVENDTNRLLVLVFDGPFNNIFPFLIFCVFRFFFHTFPLPTIILHSFCSIPFPCPIPIHPSLSLPILPHFKLRVRKYY